MIVSPIVARKYDYPPFIPLHTELLRVGVSLTAAAVYGYYELAVKQKGILCSLGSLAVECSGREVAQELGLSLPQVKRARRDLLHSGLIRTIKQPWGRPSLTVVYTFMRDDEAAPPTCITRDPTEVAKADDGATLEPDGAPEPSHTEKAEQTTAAPPRGQDKGTSAHPLEGASNGALTRRLGGVGEPSDGMPASSREGTLVGSHSSICAIHPLYSEREESTLQLYGRCNNVLLTPEEYLDILDKLGEYAEEYLDHFSSRLNDKRYRCSDHHREILDWWAGDSDNWASKHHTSEAKQSSEPGHPGNSFDTDDFFGAALKRSFGDDFELRSK